MSARVKRSYGRFRLFRKSRPDSHPPTLFGKAAASPVQPPLTREAGPIFSISLNVAPESPPIPRESSWARSP